MSATTAARKRPRAVDADADAAAALAVSSTGGFGGETPEERRLRRCRHNEIEQRRRNRMRELFERLDSLSSSGAGAAVLAAGQPPPKRQRNKNGVRKEKEAILVQAIAKLDANEREIAELRRQLAMVPAAAAAATPAPAVQALTPSAAPMLGPYAFLTRQQQHQPVSPPAPRSPELLSVSAASMTAAPLPPASSLLGAAADLSGSPAHTASTASLDAPAQLLATPPARLMLTAQGQLSHANREALSLFGIAAPAALAAAFLGNLTPDAQKKYISIVLGTLKSPGKACADVLRLAAPTAAGVTSVRLTATFEPVDSAIHAVCSPLR